MAVDITDGEVSVVRLMRAVDAQAPDQVKAQYHGFEERGDAEALRRAADPLLAKLKLVPFSAAEAGQVMALTEPQRDVMLFYSALRDPKAAALKSRIDGLIGWGAWSSVAGTVAAIPKIPFKFDGNDVRRVFDPAGAIPEMTDGQAQAKTFLNTVASEPKLADMTKQIAQYLKWGGFQSVAQLVADHPQIPFRFNADDVRRVYDPAMAIMPVDPKQIQVLSFWDVLRTHTDPKVQKFYADLDSRVHHGCWQSIASQLNSIDDFPMRPISPDLLRETLDPTGQYGNDDACSALAPPEPSGFGKAVIWTMGAGMAAYAWSEGAVDSVSDWTQGAASSVSDWTVGAANEVGDWFSGAYGDTSSWLSDAGTTTADWVTSTASDVASWTANAADTVKTSVEDTANKAGEWFSDAGRTIGGWFGF